MRAIFSMYIILLACGCTANKKEAPVSERNELLGIQWILRKPQTTDACELLLSFHEENKMVMKYRGNSYEGYYEIDSTLSNYISFNIFNKQGWDDECDVNPEYLSFYDPDTQFSYTLLDNRLYFQKREKSIVFERFNSENLKN